MKTFFSQNKILIGLVIFLLLLNIAAISSIIYQRAGVAKHTSIVTHAPFHRDRGMPRQGRFLRELLELDTEQFEEFKVARHDFHMKAWEITEELREKKVEFLKELNRKKPDTSKIQKISEDIGDLHRDLRLETGNYYLELRTICHNEQQQKLYQFFMQTFERPEMVEPVPGMGRNRHHRMIKENRNQHGKDSL